MTTAIVGPSLTGGGTPLGQKVLFPYTYPDVFTLNGEEFTRTGVHRDNSAINPDLLQFTKFARKSVAISLSTKLAPATVTSAVQTAAGISKGNTILIGNQGAVLRSIDFGETWTKVVIPEINTNHFYGIAGNGAGTWMGIANSKVWKSTDDGLTWNEVTSVTTSALAFNRVVYLGNNCWVVGATSGGALRRTTDNGANWSSVNLTNFSVSTAYMFAGSDSGVMVVQGFNSAVGAITYWWSRDRGATFTAGLWFSGATAASNTLGGNYDRQAHPGTFAFGENGRILAIRHKSAPNDSSSWGSYIREGYLSIDNGVSWIPVNVSEGSPAGWGGGGNVAPGSGHCVTYVGDDLFYIYANQNEVNGGSYRSETSGIYVDISTTPITVRITSNLALSSGQANGSDFSGVNEVIPLFDPITKAIFVTSNANGLSCGKSTETISGGSTQAAYVGGTAGYDSALVYYTRTK